MEFRQQPSGEWLTYPPNWKGKNFHYKFGLMERSELTRLTNYGAPHFFAMVPVPKTFSEVKAHIAGWQIPKIPDTAVVYYHRINGYFESICILVEEAE